MAKNRNGRRGNVKPTNRRLPPSPRLLSRTINLDTGEILRSVSDNRPEPVRRTRAQQPRVARAQTNVRSIVRSVKKLPKITQTLLPTPVHVCVKRSIRKEIMHALNHAGKSGQRRPRRNRNSLIRC